MEILNVNNNNYRSPAGYVYIYIYKYNNNNNNVFEGRAADRDATSRNLQSYSLPGPHLIGTTIITRERIRRGWDILIATILIGSNESLKVYIYSRP